MSIDLELMADTVEKMVNARLAEMDSLVKTHGVQFAASTMLSVCAHIAGVALATCEDERGRQSGGIAFISAMHNRMTSAGAEFDAINAIKKAMEKA